MENVMNVAKELGYLDIPDGILIDMDEIDNYAPERLVLITTGSQGEEMSGLSRMAAGTHRRVTITNRDLVIISATPIPGNEKLVSRVINELLRKGVEVVYNHADYRLLSSRAIDALKEFKEVNVYLRGMVPLVGFKSTSVEYARNERLAGKSHYPLKKMLSLALNGITSMSIKPIRLITALGSIIAAISFIAVIWSVISYFIGVTVTGWASTMSIICFLGGIQLLCLGIIGEYIGKIYLEVKGRPRYIISERTNKDE